MSLIHPQGEQISSISKRPRAHPLGVKNSSLQRWCAAWLVWLLAVKTKCVKCLRDRYPHSASLNDAHTIAGIKHGPGIMYTKLFYCCLLNYACAQTLDYTLRCPICAGDCAFGLYIHQFDPDNDDCCYFACVTCISKLRTKVGVPASAWQRWHESDIAQHSEASWRPCAMKTVEIMAKAKSKKKRKRTDKKKKPTTTDTDDDAVREMIQRVNMHLSTVESRVRVIRRILLEFATREDS